MDTNIYEEKLKAPFQLSDIGFRISRVNKNNRKAHVLAYITARAIFERLDSIFGISNWIDSYEVIQEGVICSLSVKIEDAWVTKQDAAPFTSIESLKGGFSDALKRAAVKFGIGRYLYSLPEYQVDLLQSKPYNVDPSKVHYYYSPSVSGNWISPELPEWALPSGSPTKGENDTPKISTAEADRPDNNQNQKPSNDREELATKISQLLESLVLQGAVTEKKKNEYYKSINNVQIGVGLLKYFHKQLLLIDHLYSLVRLNKIKESDRKELYSKILTSKMNQFPQIESSLTNYAA